MDPVMMLWALLNHISETSPPIPQANTVQVAPAPAPANSFADVARGILKCYHPTARYQLADVVQQPWDRQEQYRADGSALIRIQFFGAMSGNKYEMKVALLAKNEPKQLRTAVLDDNAPFNPSPNCKLDRWTAF